MISMLSIECHKFIFHRNRTEYEYQASIVGKRYSMAVCGAEPEEPCRGKASESTRFYFA